MSELAIFCQAAPSLILAMSDTLISDSGPSFRQESDVVEHCCRPIEQQVRPTSAAMPPSSGVESGNVWHSDRGLSQVRAKLHLERKVTKPLVEHCCYPFEQ